MHPKENSQQKIMLYLNVNATSPSCIVNRASGATFSDRAVLALSLQSKHNLVLRLFPMEEIAKLAEISEITEYPLRVSFLDRHELL
jgi:hypothetical protein